MGRVSGKTAIVTGGGAGIGQAAARLLAVEGATVLITDVDARAGELTANEIARAGGRSLFVRQDVALEADWQQVFDTVRKEFGYPDILVNNAGIADAGNVEDTTLAEWHRMLRINLDSVFIGTQHAIREMKGHGGSIVNISSIFGLVGDPDLAGYNASKGGVRLLTKSAALHCARAGYKIRVNSIHPGYIWTPMLEAYGREQGDVDAVRRRLDELHPLGHVGEPEDIAYGVLYLASEESRFITGSELVIDGGFTCR